MELPGTQYTKASMPTPFGRGQRSSMVPLPTAFTPLPIPASPFSDPLGRYTGIPNKIQGSVSDCRRAAATKHRTTSTGRNTSKAHVSIALGSSGVRQALLDSTVAQTTPSIEKFLVYVYAYPMRSCLLQ
jgi:hypothetical protein